VCLIDWGYLALADFISTIPTMKDTSIIVGMVNVVKPVPKELLAQANEQYKVFGSARVVQALQEKLYLELVCNEWKFRFGRMEEFNIELYKLILRSALK
jgi:hypothetical protein